MDPTELSYLKKYIERRNTATNEKGCWLIEGNDWSNYQSGYWLGTSDRMHRLSACAFHNYSLTSVKHVLHKCDVKGCFNPEHLFIGDSGTNQLDARMKGRQKGFKVTTKESLDRYIKHYQEHYLGKEPCL